MAIHLDSKWTDATKSEVVAFYSSNTVGDVTCTAAFHKNGQWGDYSITFVPAGVQHMGGEQGGLWTPATTVRACGTLLRGPLASGQQGKLL